MRTNRTAVEGRQKTTNVASRPGATCTRCVMDTSDPDITFDGDGVCSYCRRAEVELLTVRWTPAESDRALASVVEEIRKAGVGKEYDSVIGLSGGVDSSYVAYLAHKLGLRPLAVHFDNGWNSELAVENIQRVVEACSFDLHTVVINWREFRDLQRAFLRASVVDIEILTDHAIIAATAAIAREHDLRYLLSGDNRATEHGLPGAWVWDKLDWTNIRAIHSAHGTEPLRTFPHVSMVRFRATEMLGMGVKTVKLLNLTNYRRDEAAATLEREFGWREYGGKHHESAFTKFYQGAILPRKFGIDKRRVHLSDRLRNGEVTRDEALAIVACPPYQPDELRAESDYVRKKLGFDEAEWAAIMSAPPRSHLEYASDRRLAGPIRTMFRVIRRIRSVIRPSGTRRETAQHEPHTTGT
jgi:N-acetyl sugar amidotransferase